MSARMVAQSQTVEAIVAFALRAEDGMLSDAARDRLKRSILDGLGCAIGAVGAGPVRAIRATVDVFGGRPLYTLIGGGHTAPDRAALYNGYLVRYLDFMDAHHAIPLSSVGTAQAGKVVLKQTGDEAMASWTATGPEGLPQEVARHGITRSADP